MDNRFQIISPGTGELLTERSYASESEIETTLSKASGAFQKWRRTPLSDRIEYCRKALTFFMDHADELAEEITLQMGRPIRYSPMEIRGGLKERAEYMMGIAEKSLEELALPEKAGFTRYIRKEPLGGVLVLAPWNYPYLTAVNALIPALLAGNTVILKHADQTALCAERYAEAFREAGLPDGVFQYVYADHGQVARMVKDHRIAHVAFTGSVPGGHAVQQALSSRFASIGLELGGKDPAYVSNTVDLPNAIENLVDGAFFNSGQSCCGIERIYVHENHYEEFIHGFANLTREYVLGDPMNKETTLGPMVRVSNARKVLDQVEQALKKGAQKLIATTDFPVLNLPYVAPQVLINVNHSMELMKEESFGPVVGIMSVKSDEEAIRLMNDSDYGLTASIWTDDMEKAIRIGNEIETGTWFMNRCDYLDPALAWTGVKNSGRGCTLSVLGYDHVTRPKSFHLKHP